MGNFGIGFDSFLLIPAILSNDRFPGQTAHSDRVPVTPELLTEPAQNLCFINGFTRRDRQMDIALFRPLVEGNMALDHHVHSGKAVFRRHVNRRERIDDWRTEGHQSGYCRKVHQESVEKGYIVDLLREYAD